MALSASKTPAAPKKPGAPKKPTTKSKTGNSACSEAASNWQLAIRGKEPLDPGTYKTLAQCRAMSSQKKTATLHERSGKLSEQGRDALVGRLQKRADKGLLYKKDREARLKMLLEQRKAKKQPPAQARPEKTKEQIQQQRDRITTKSRAEYDRLYYEAQDIRKGAYPFEDKINRARSEKGKAKATAEGQAYVAQNQPRMNAIAQRRQQIEQRISTTQISSEYMQQPKAVRDRFTKETWVERTKLAEAKAQARQDAIHYVVREGIGQNKYKPGESAYFEREKRYARLSGQATGKGDYIDPMGFANDTAKQYFGQVKGKYERVKLKMEHNQAVKAQEKAEFLKTPEGYRQSVREEAARKLAVTRIAPRRDPIGTVYPTATLQREADVKHEMRVLGKQQSRKYHRSSPENRSDRMLDIYKIRKENADLRTEDKKREIDDRLYDAIDNAKRYAPDYKKRNPGEGGALNNRGSAFGKLTPQDMAERQAAAQKIHAARKEYHATPEMQAKFAEQDARARERSRKKFGLFGGQLPDERPYVPPAVAQRVETQKTYEQAYADRLQRKKNADIVARGDYYSHEVSPEHRKRTAQQKKDLRLIEQTRKFGNVDAMPLGLKRVLPKGSIFAFDRNGSLAVAKPIGPNLDMVKGVSLSHNVAKGIHLKPLGNYQVYDPVGNKVAYATTADDPLKDRKGKALDYLFTRAKRDMPNASQASLEDVYTSATPLTKQAFKGVVRAENYKSITNGNGKTVQILRHTPNHNRQLKKKGSKARLSS